jgi:hypothetical protein
MVTRISDAEWLGDLLSGGGSVSLVTAAVRLIAMTWSVTPDGELGGQP